MMVEIGRAGMRDPQRQEQFEAAKAELVGLSDVEGIEQRYPYARHSKADGDRIRRWAMEVASHWPSLVSHYIEGVRTDSVRVMDPVALQTKNAAARSAQRVAMVNACNPTETTAWEKLVGEAAAARDVRGRPLIAGSAEYLAWLRHEAVKRGISPSPGATIFIGLRQAEKEWRITSVTVEPLPPTASQPAGSH